MPMAASSQEELPGGEAGAADEDKLERERADADARQMPDQVLLDKLQRTQDMLLAGQIVDRLPDRGRKLRWSLDAMQRELTRRQATGGGARAPCDDGCERIVRSRCAESSDTRKANQHRRMDQLGRRPGSGLHSDPNRAKLSKADFQSSFRVDEKADLDICSLEITSRHEPDTSVKNEGKLCNDEDSCKPSSQPTNFFDEELHVDTSSNMEKISSDDASNNNGHSRTCQTAHTPSRKRKPTAAVPGKGASIPPVRCSLPQISRAPNRSRSGSPLAVDASSPLLPPAVAASPSLSPPPLSPPHHLPLAVAASPTSPTPSRRRRLPLPATFLSPSPPPPSPPPAPAKNLWELRCGAPATPCRAGREPLVGLAVVLQPHPAALAPFASTATTTKERPPHLPPRPPRRTRSGPPGRDAAPTTAATLESTGSTQSPPK
ncbi:unnamed protein product [Urochloa humidicola]